MGGALAACRLSQLSKGSHHAQYAPVTGERTLRPNAGPVYDLVAFLTPKRSLVDTGIAGAGGINVSKNC